MLKIRIFHRIIHSLRIIYGLKKEYNLHRQHEHISYTINKLNFFFEVIPVIVEIAFINYAFLWLFDFLVILHLKMLTLAILLHLDMLIQDHNIRKISNFKHKECIQMFKSLLYITRRI